MFSPDELKAATVEMIKARKVLEDYEKTHGYAQSEEHARLSRNFNKFAESYLVMSTASFVHGRMSTKKK